MSTGKKSFILAILFLTIMAITACGGDQETVDDKARENASEEQEALVEAFAKLVRSQQIPSFDWSQERETYITILTARAEGAVGTAAFMLEGVGMIKWCPTLGGPLPSTYQISPDEQYIDLPNDRTDQRFPVSLGEPTGLYVGDGNGTWILCLDDEGNPFPKYYEGYVDFTFAQVEYDPELRERPAELSFVVETGND